MAEDNEDQDVEEVEAEKPAGSGKKKLIILIVLGVLMLFLVWRSAPIPKIEIATVPRSQPPALEIYPNQTSRLLSATIGSPGAFKQSSGLGPNNNLPVLALGSGVALGLASATLRFASRRRFPGAQEASERRHSPRRVVSHSPLL